MTGFVKSVAKIMGAMNDPVLSHGAKAISKNNPDNKLVSNIIPGARIENRLDNGEPLTLGLAGDAGSVFNESGEEKAKRLQAEQQARLNATPPSITSANIASRQQADRLKRRRGVLANIYGGSSGDPQAATKVLLGS